MTVRTRRVLLPSVVAMSLALTACGTEETESLFSDLNLVGESEGPDTTLGRALSLIDADDFSYIGFTDQTRVSSLGTAEWGLLTAIGSPLANYDSSALDIDIDSADLLVTLGDSSLIHGGQSPAEIIEAAESAGWEGDGILHQSPVSTEPLTIPAPSILPFDESVAYGSVVEGFQPSETSLYDAPSAHSLTLCLGDVISAVLMPGIAVGVSDDGGVICSIPDASENSSDLADDIVSHLETSPYVTDLEPETTDDAAKVTYTHTRDADPTTMINELTSGGYRTGFTS